MSCIFGSLKRRRRNAYRHIVNQASSLKYPINSQRTRWNLPFSATHFRLTPPSLGNLHEYSNKSYTGSIFIQFFVVGSERRFFSATECVSAIQGHPRSLIFGTNRKGVCDFLLVINSNFSPILHRFWDRPTATYWLKIANFSYPTLI